MRIQRSGRWPPAVHPALPRPSRPPVSGACSQARSWFVISGTAADGAVDGTGPDRAGMSWFDIAGGTPPRRRPLRWRPSTTPAPPTRWSGPTEPRPAGSIGTQVTRPATPGGWGDGGSPSTDHPGRYLTPTGPRVAAGAPSPWAGTPPRHTRSASSSWGAGSDGNRGESPFSGHCRSGRRLGVAPTDAGGGDPGPRLEIAVATARLGAEWRRSGTLEPSTGCPSARPWSTSRGPG